MPCSNYTTSEDRVFINPLEKQQDWTTTCDAEEDGAEAPTQRWGKQILHRGPTPGWHSTALLRQSAAYWGLHHRRHPPHISCDTRVPPGKGAEPRDCTLPYTTLTTS